MAGHLKEKPANPVNSVLCFLSFNFFFFFLEIKSKKVKQKCRRSPVTPHPACEIVTSFLGLHEDDGLVLFPRHDLLHQLDQPAEIVSNTARRETHF